MPFPENVTFAFESDHVVMRIEDPDYVRAQGAWFRAMGYTAEQAANMIWDDIRTDMSEIAEESMAKLHLHTIDFSPVQLADVCLGEFMSRSYDLLYFDQWSCEPIDDECILRERWTREYGEMVDGHWPPDVMTRALESALAGRFDDARAIAKSVFDHVRIPKRPPPPTPPTG